MDDALRIHGQAGVSNVGQACDALELNLDQFLIDRPDTAGETVLVACFDHGQALLDAGDIRLVAHPDLRRCRHQRKDRAAEHDHPKEPQGQG